MPTVEKTSGGRVYLRSVGQRVSRGDQVGVSEDKAEYLVEERGDFKRVDGVTDVEYEEVDPDDSVESDSDDLEGICGVEMSDGSTCERPADECGYHED